jgi:hypothetical protein
MFSVKKYKFNMLVEQPQNTIMGSCKRQIKIYLSNSLIVIKLWVLCWSICVLFKLNTTDTWKAIYCGHRKKLIKILKNYAQQPSCYKTCRFITQYKRTRHSFLWSVLENSLYKLNWIPYNFSHMFRNFVRYSC